jgi:hypothetical protein
VGPLRKAVEETNLAARVIPPHMALRPGISASRTSFNVGNDQSQSKADISSYYQAMPPSRDLNTHYCVFFMHMLIL